MLPRVPLLFASALLVACHSGAGDAADAASPDLYGGRLDDDAGTRAPGLCASPGDAMARPVVIERHDASGAVTARDALADFDATLTSIDTVLHFTSPAGDFSLVVTIDGALPAPFATLPTSTDVHVAFADGVTVADAATGALRAALFDYQGTGTSVSATIGALHFTQGAALCAAVHCGTVSPSCEHGAGGCYLGYETNEVRADGMTDPLLPGTTTTLGTSDVTVVFSGTQVPPDQVGVLTGGVGGCLAYAPPTLTLIVVPHA